MTDASTPENVVSINSALDPELQAQLNALFALATTHQLLSVGCFQAAAFHNVEQAKEFIATLHGQALEKALAHPDSDKVPVLVEAKKAREKKDGEITAVDDDKKA